MTGKEPERRRVESQTKKTLCNSDPGRLQRSVLSLLVRNHARTRPLFGVSSLWKGNCDAWNAVSYALTVIVALGTFDQVFRRILFVPGRVFPANAAHCVHLQF